MGLDVYLERCPNLDECLRQEREYGRRSHAIWEELAKTHKGANGNLTDEGNILYQERHRQLEAEIGLGKWGRHPDRVRVEQNSTLDPNHLFKVGYFRSSYNGSGIDSYLCRLGLPTLDALFCVRSGDYYVRPDWRASRERVVALLEALEARAKTPEGKYDVGEVCCFDGRPRSAAEALEVFKGELTKSSPFEAYENGDGLFSIKDPIKVVAMIAGVGETDEPCVYFVYECEDKADWYVRAIRIVLETVDYVLNQPNPQDYYFVWSG